MHYVTISYGSTEKKKKKKGRVDHLKEHLRVAWLIGNLRKKSTKKGRD